MLNVEYINCFITATLQTLEVMAAVRPTRGAPFVKADEVAKGDISGVIGLAGDATGSVAVTFPESLAIEIYSNMVGEAASSLDEGVKDAIGEVANMIAGGAKAGLSQNGFSFRIAIPTVVVGKNHSIEHKGGFPCLCVPFHMREETFWLEVSFGPAKRA
ncbi:MAG: chemotaxis protein CheX [Deltaproteobacteria bacterium]|nr:chemotaxis protein CheX [Deltaproteobacteria bacterium]